MGADGAAKSGRRGGGACFVYLCLIQKLLLHNDK